MNDIEKGLGKLFDQSAKHILENQKLREEVSRLSLQNDELKKLLVRVYACHQPDVCDCDTPADGPHSDSCISTRVAEVSLQTLTEKRKCDIQHPPNARCEEGRCPWQQKKCKGCGHTDVNLGWCVEVQRGNFDELHCRSCCDSKLAWSYAR